MKKVIFNIIFKKDNLIKKVVFLSPKWKKLITFFKLTKAKSKRKRFTKWTYLLFLKTRVLLKFIKNKKE